MIDEEDYEIDLLDLAKTLLKKWKVILVVTLAFGMFGNIYGYIKDNNHLKALAGIKEQYDLNENYYTTSILEKMADLNESSVAKVLATVNKTEILNNQLAEQDQLLNTLYMDEEMILDCLEYLVVDDNGNSEACNDVANSLAIGFETSLDNNNIKMLVDGQIIYLYILDDSAISELKKDFDTYLATSYQGITLKVEYLGNYKNTAQDISNLILNIQNENMDDDDKDNVLTKDLTTDELALYNEIISAKGSESSALADNVSFLQIKEVAIGAVIGFIIICGIYFCIYAFSNTIKTGDELYTVFGLTNLIDLDNLNKLLKKNKYRQVYYAGNNHLSLVSCPIEKAEVVVILVATNETKYAKVKEAVLQAKSYNIPVLGYLLNK